MNWDLDPSQYFGVLAVVGYVIYQIIKYLFGGNNKELDEFLKSIDADEEELHNKEHTPPPPRPHPKKEPPKPVHPVHKVQAPSSPKPLKKFKYQPEIKAVYIQKEKLLNPRTIKEAIVIQTILNKPTGAWW